MREHKFRAWHKEMRILVRVIDFYLSDGTVHLPIETNVTDEYWWGSTTWDLDDVILMQYTGLKDKNGHEIYEGDVVFVNHHPFDYDGNYEVGYNEVMELCAGSLILHRVKNYCEVIGNIYEHSHLLEGN